VLHNHFVVETKVQLINRLYNTNIYAWRRVAENIVEHAAILESDLARGRANAIRTLAQCGIHGRVASFATKFAHFHNPDAFTMWDDRVQRAVVNLRERELIGWNWKPRGSDLAATYQAFRNQIMAICEHFRAIGGVSVSFKTVDVYLWLKGVRLHPRHASAEVRWASETLPALWATL